MATPTLKYVAPSTPEADLAFDPEPVVIYGVPGGGDSGIQSIVAGTNVTVDSTDPYNPIVSATGGGGGGAVDSVNGQTGVVVLDIPETPEDIGAATATQGTKADTAVQPAALSSYVPTTRTVAGKPLSSNVALDKVDVGLASVDNTSDANKPVSTAQQTALNLKANTADVVPNTRTVAGKALSANVTLAKADVGLGSVDNTADTAKPVSTATQTALNGKVSGLNGVTGLWKGTQAAYNALTPDANVIYVIQG